MPEFAPQKFNMNDPQKAQTSVGLFVSKPLFKRIASMGVDLLFPPRCAGCGQIDTFWCINCQREIDEMNLSERIEARPPLEDVSATAWHIGKLREAVQALKYENVPALAKPLGEKLAHC